MDRSYTWKNQIKAAEFMFTIDDLKEIENAFAGIEILARVIRSICKNLRTVSNP